jgi:hypothetical protein
MELFSKSKLIVHFDNLDDKESAYDFLQDSSNFQEEKNNMFQVKHFEPEDMKLCSRELIQKINEYINDYKMKIYLNNFAYFDQKIPQRFQEEQNFGSYHQSIGKTAPVNIGNFHQMNFMGIAGGYANMTPEQLIQMKSMYENLGSSSSNK